MVQPDFVKAYLILAHKNAAQVARLITTLHDNRSLFFVHVDARVPFSEFALLQTLKVPLYWVPRVATAWGSFGLVQATLNGLKLICEAPQLPQYIILLSGQDYPIKSNQHIHAFAAAHQQQTFLEHYALPCAQKWSPGGGLYRVNKYFLGLQWYQKLIAKAMNLGGLLVPPLQRKAYKTMMPYAGSMWWMMNRSTAQYVLAYVAANKSYTAYHRFTFAPDEVFFHMLLLHASDAERGSTIVNSDVRYIQWADKDAAHPQTLTAKHFPAMMAADALFARKFDAAVDGQVLDLIDLNRSTNKMVPAAAKATATLPQQRLHDETLL